MTINAQARSGYAAATSTVRTGRAAEYEIFAKITYRLRSFDETDKSVYPAFAAAICDNQRLWSRLAEDLRSDANTLPIQLRAQLISLSEFVLKHTLRVLAGKASVEALIDINTSIMRGLRGEVEVSA